MRIANKYLLLLLIGGSATGSAQTAPAAAACSSQEHRQLDFWVGDWTAAWELNGVRGTGKNKVTRDEYGSCVITERFSSDDGSLKGISISTYLPAAAEWRQTWMDDSGGYFDLAGGQVKGEAHVFALELYRRSPNASWRRMIWENVKQDSFTWRWQQKDSADGAWTDGWVIHYSRVAPVLASTPK